MSPQAETNRITTTEFVETMTIERGGDNDDLDEQKQRRMTNVR